MTSLTTRATALASGAAIDAARATLALVRDLAWSCVLASALRLPLAVAAGVLVCLAIAAVPAWVVFRHEQPAVAAQAWLVVLLLLYGIAGVVWGVHWTLHRGALAGLAVLQRRIPEAVDTLLAPLMALGDETLPSLPIGGVRGYFEQAAAQALSLPGVPRWRWLSWLTTRIARWCLRAELAVVEQVLSRLEARGETHVSLGSLKGCVRDELAARAGGAARVQLLQFDLAAAAVVLLLLVVPTAVLVWVT